ncbi:pyruvate ferredoxin oxidoreductase [Nocardioides sp. Root122]|uniref:transketolase C-terminal domain-containing protein n=1 Tax=Nocardioides TaxID=1839 RepID=UPI0007039BA3|nr:MULTISPECIES: transketolase C-terminal domain-containing protein [Nocardioides]KQV72726.1 pyruvate ferredoxin oxidoreductase [Nocardioides sp. Root122]MCK9825372.1 pyruvate ferredoxin oxidoreductase [Nocardioides cavernae]
MLRQLEGSQAVARAVTLCRPQVIAAYPISPQTHIVESLSDRVRTGELEACEYMMVESEFGAMSACIGASGAGVRTYTATSSQGLLFMAEALFNASGLGLPIVMTVANRAIGAPINIWNDHSDAMSMRDSGWIQLYADSNQSAVDLHVQAYRLAESLSVPVMVCMDGFILTHAFEEVDLPEQEQVDAFLPRFRPQQALDPDDPLTIGAMVGPEAFAEVKYLMHVKQMAALDEIPMIADDFREAFGRASGGLLQPYRVEGAETVVVALGSVLGTIEDVVDTMRDEGVAVGVLGITCFRPWPVDEVREALRGAQRVVVVEKAFAVGAGGIVGQNVRDAVRGSPVQVYDVVAGLGGRPITRASLRGLLDDVLADRVDPGRLYFLDLDHELVQRELERARHGERPGPHAENMLRALGTVASGAYE